MNEIEQLKAFADQLWKYMKPKLDDAMSSTVRYFRAEVVSNPGDGTLVIHRPYDTSNLTVPCTTAMSGAQTGDQVIVFVLGNLSNAVVIADGKMNMG